MNSELTNSISIKATISNGSIIKASILNGNNLTGILRIDNNMAGVLSDTQSLKGVIKENTNIVYETNLDNSSSYPSYDGSYDIIPRVDEQTLETKNKVLRDDVLVESIPYYQTSNPYGNTVYIG